MIAPGVISGWVSSIDPRVWQAVLAGLFVAIGWIVNGAQNRREARKMARDMADKASKNATSSDNSGQAVLVAKIGPASNQG